MGRDKTGIVGTVFVLGVLCSIGLFIYAHWDALATTTIVLASIAVSGGAIVYCTRYYLSVEYCSPIVKYIRAEKYERALELTDRLKPHRFAMMERNEERQLLSALDKLADQNDVLAKDVARWKEELKNEGVTHI